jgi:hypothetical protein
VPFEVAGKVMSTVQLCVVWVQTSTLSTSTQPIVVAIHSEHIGSHGRIVSVSIQLLRIDCRPDVQDASMGPSMDP